MATQYPEQPQPIDDIEDEINRFFDRIVACVDLRRRTLIAEAREKKEEKRAKLERKQQSERQLIELKTDTEHKLKENILREMQEKILKDIEEKLSEVRLQEAETRLVFQGDLGQLEEMILGLGEVLEQISAIPRYQDLKVTVAVGKEGLENGEILYAIAIDEKTNNIYIAQGSDDDVTCARVSVYSETGEFLTNFGQEHLKFPQSITIHGNYVYVTDCTTHRVLQYEQGTDIRLVNSVGGFGSENGKFNHPRQACVSNKGDVYVTDSENNRIQILNGSLHFLRSLSHPSMTKPQDIKLTQDQIYVLSTGDSHCIHVLSHTGEKIRSMITRSEGKQVTYPLYFCMDANNNIIISDYWANCVKVFSNKGTLLHIIQGNVVSPKGIALTKDFKLVIVSRNKNYGLQIFS